MLISVLYSSARLFTELDYDEDRFTKDSMILICCSWVPIFNLLIIIKCSFKLLSLIQYLFPLGNVDDEEKHEKYI